MSTIATLEQQAGSVLDGTLKEVQAVDSSGAPMVDQNGQPVMTMEKDKRAIDKRWETYVKICFWHFGVSVSIFLVGLVVTTIAGSVLAFSESAGFATWLWEALGLILTTLGVISVVGSIYSRSADYMTVLYFGGKPVFYTEDGGWMYKPWKITKLKRVPKSVTPYEHPGNPETQVDFSGEGLPLQAGKTVKAIYYVTSGMPAGSATDDPLQCRATLPACVSAIVRVDDAPQFLATLKTFPAIQEIVFDTIKTQLMEIMSTLHGAAEAYDNRREINRRLFIALNEALNKYGVSAESVGITKFDQGHDMAKALNAPAEAQLHAIAAVNTAKGVKQSRKLVGEGDASATYSDLIAKARGNAAIKRQIGDGAMTALIVGKAMEETARAAPQASVVTIGNGSSIVDMVAAATRVAGVASTGGNQNPQTQVAPRPANRNRRSGGNNTPPTQTTPPTTNGGNAP